MLKYVPDAYRPLPVTKSDHVEDLRQALHLRADMLHHPDLPIIQGTPGPCSPLILDLKRQLQWQHPTWPVPLETEEGIESERVWFDIYHPGGDPLIDALLLAMKSEHTPLSETEIWRLCYRLAIVFAGSAESGRDRFQAMALARRKASAKGGKPGEVKGPHRWAWRFLVENLESVAYDSDGRRLSRYALSERLHGEILHAEWRRKHPGARFAPANSLPSAKTLRESPIWLKGMGLEKLPKVLGTAEAPV
ncbi:hypothetical protein [Billgrantia desiderata]|uniref:hypothetical protein n=1 Tax=Billgrantia desiderata TaxID=52021 RepID=UPI003F331BFE